LEFITYKSLPRLGHLALHVDEVQVVVDAAAKVASFGFYYIQILPSVGAPGPACRRSSGGGGRRWQGGFVLLSLLVLPVLLLLLCCCCCCCCCCHCSCSLQAWQLWQETKSSCCWTKKPWAAMTIHNTTPSTVLST